MKPPSHDDGFVTEGPVGNVETPSALEVERPAHTDGRDLLPVYIATEGLHVFGDPRAEHAHDVLFAHELAPCVEEWLELAVGPGLLLAHDEFDRAIEDSGLDRFIECQAHGVELIVDGIAVDRKVLQYPEPIRVQVEVKAHLRCGPRSSSAVVHIHDSPTTAGASRGWVRATAMFNDEASIVTCDIHDKSVDSWPT